mgnify:CR=1 FL=1
MLLKSLQQVGLVLRSAASQGGPLQRQSLEQDLDDVGVGGKFWAGHHGQEDQGTVPAQGVEVRGEVVFANEVDNEVDAVFMLFDFLLEF